MKKTTFILLMILSFSLPAQNYTFSNLSGTYADLTGTTSLNNDEIWDDPEYTLTLPFAFTVNGTTSNTLSVFDGTLVQTVTSTTFQGLAVLNADLEDRGSNGATSLSPISFKTDGIGGSRIVKVEFKNCGAYSDFSKTMFVNFQIWLYEGSNVIEYRYGPSSITNSDVFYDDETGPLVGISGSDLDDILTNTHLLTGPANNPTLSTATSFVYLTGTPIANAIFRFTPTVLNTTAFTNSNISVYPNPFTDFVTIQGLKESYNYSIFDVSGKLVHSSENNLPTDRIDTKSITDGVYLLKIISGSETLTKKIIKM